MKRKITPQFRTFLRLFLASVLSIFATLSTPCLAQVSVTSAPPPVIFSDINGVDLKSGTIGRDALSISIGAAEDPIFEEVFGRTGPTSKIGTAIGGHITNIRCNGLASSYYCTSWKQVTIGGYEAWFTLNGQSPGGFVSGAGETLTSDGNTITVTLKDGTVALFNTSWAPVSQYGSTTFTSAVLYQLTRPNGEVIKSSNYYLDGSGYTTSSAGYMMVAKQNSSQQYETTLVNRSSVFCDNAGVCAPSTFVWPKAIVYGEVTTNSWFQDALGYRTYGQDSTVNARTSRQISNSASSYTFTRSYINRTINPITSFTDGNGNVTTYTYTLWGNENGAGTIVGGSAHYANNENYSYGVSDSGYILKHGDGAGITVKFKANIYPGPYGSGESSDLDTITYAEGNSVHYDYDARRNRTQVTYTPKAGSGLAALTSTAHYPETCSSSNLKICNQPEYVIDTANNRTDYTYDARHGGALTKTLPAGANGIRPQTRFTYQQLSSRYLDASGQLVADTPIWKLTSTSTCQTQVDCAGTADEVVTSYAYNDNLLPISETTRSGDGMLTATVTRVYDPAGNVISVDGPLAGAGDTSRYIYNALRRKVGEISPDPDGTGPRRNRAERFTYDQDGRATVIEVGWTAGQADADWLAFTPLQQTTVSYDFAGRKIKEVTGFAGAIQSVKQYAYDGANHLICTAVRMNPDVFTSPPANACVLGTQGVDGPDRITRVMYDFAGQVTKVQEGYLTELQRDERTNTWTDNGYIKTIADGKPTGTADGRGNLTTYAYDGLDRLATVNYPVAIGTGSSATDYEQYTYDNLGNRVSWRRRSGEIVAFTYDALSRVKNGLRGETYTYDNLGRRLTASYAGGVGSATYDALGRMTSETTANKVMTYGYDAAGNRIRSTWPDGFAVAYGRDNTGTITSVSAYEAANTPTSLATYAYDDLSRPTSVTRGAGGPTTYYAYDAASRLACLSHGVVCADPAPTWKFTYTAAGQVKQRAARSALYEWPGSPGNRTYGINGLNQITSVASTTTDTVSYDLRGNMSLQGGVTYGYDLLNNLISTASGGVPQANLAYEPTGRLWQVTASGATTNFLYSGSDLVAEYVNGAISRRYVPGPGTDAPLVWYEGAGFADRRYLLADPQGSIVSVNSANGAASVNTYDEYGIPGGDNVGRFRYTGQIWLPEVGLYHYKARAYSPTLGRFLQTDPTGYDDGLNWYAYVGNDPLNKGDPTGEGALETIQNILADPETPGAVAQILGGGSLALLGGTGVGASGVGELASGGLASPIAIPAAIGSAAVAGAGIGIAANGQAKWNAIIHRSETGSYTNTHESGKTYSGKGSRERSQVSGRRVERATGDKHTATEWKKSGSDRDAFKAEAQRIKDNGGAKDPGNYNKVESPGKKYLDQ